MNVEVVTPCIEGTKQVLAMFSVNAKMGKAVLKEKPFDDKFNVTIGIIGDYTGSVIYGFGDDVALFLAGKMMGSPISNLDEISLSAIKELCNMVSGTIATLFSKNEEIIDIRPPKFSHDYASCDLPKFISIPFNLGDGMEMELNLWLEKSE